MTNKVEELTRRIKEARDAEDWALCEKLWEERRVAEVQADEAQIKPQAMSDYEGGYRAAVSRTMINQVADHWSGKQRLDRADDWFAGYQDAEDDLKWRAQGVEQMQFGL